MSNKATGKHTVSQFNFKLDLIIAECNELIEEYMNSYTETDKKIYSIFNFLKKKRNINDFNHLEILQVKIQQANKKYSHFCDTNSHHFSQATQCYLHAYGNYLKEVYKSVKLRFKFEKIFLGLNCKTTTIAELNEMKRIMRQINSSLKSCEQEACHVNVIVQRTG